MNHVLLDALANPSFDLEEAERNMHLAGQEIVRLERRVAELSDCNRRLQIELEKLSLDLGVREQGYFK